MSNNPSETSLELAEEVRESAPNFGIVEWEKGGPFSIHLAECFDIAYNMGMAFERAKTILDKKK